MEAELEKFRKKKKADERNAKVREKLNNLWNTVTGKICQSILPDPQPSSHSSSLDEEEEEEDENGQEFRKKRTKIPRRNRIKNTGGASESDCDLTCDPNCDSTSNTHSTTEGRGRMLNAAVRILQFLVWLLVYVGFIKIGFGAVFFTISALIFIWRNTRTSDEEGDKKGKGKRKKGVSAYSVFNENCEAIDGSLKAEHLEKQLLYRS